MRNLLNQTFGNLTVLKRNGSKRQEAAWLCQCKLCDGTKTIRGADLTSGNTTSCGCTIRLTGPGSRRWRGYGEINKKWWTSTIKSAKKRDIDFDITIEQAWELFLKQNRICALTGRLLVFTQCTTKYSDTTASLDRIDSKKGYVIDNIQWVHKDVNRVKWVLSNQEFLALCKEVVEHEKSTYSHVGLKCRLPTNRPSILEEGGDALNNEPGEPG